MKANYRSENFGNNEAFQNALTGVVKVAADLPESEYQAMSRAVSTVGAKALDQITGEFLTPTQAQALVESLLMKLALDLAYTGLPASDVERYILALSDVFTIVAGGVDWSQ